MAIDQNGPGPQGFPRAPSPTVIENDGTGTCVERGTRRPVWEHGGRFMRRVGHLSRSPRRSLTRRLGVCSLAALGAVGLFAGSAGPALAQHGFTPPPGLPTITNIAPTSGPVGTTVTITGTNLASANLVTIGFNSVPAPLRI